MPNVTVQSIESNVQIEKKSAPGQFYLATRITYLENGKQEVDLLTQSQLNKPENATLNLALQQIAAMLPQEVVFVKKVNGNFYNIVAVLPKGSPDTSDPKPAAKSGWGKGGGFNKGKSKEESISIAKQVAAKMAVDVGKKTPEEIIAFAKEVVPYFTEHLKDKATDAGVSPALAVNPFTVAQPAIVQTPAPAAATANGFTVIE